MSNKERTNRLKSLGYQLKRNQRNSIGKTYAYQTSPAYDTGRLTIGGPTCYFHDLEAVDRYILHAEKIRSWQNDMLPMPGEPV